MVRIFSTLIIALLLLQYSTIDAQNANAVIVSSPDEAAGIYRVVGANGWGGITANEEGLEAIFADNSNGCGMIGNVTGKVAFIDRGGCGFSLKAFNAQQGGAAACIICNNNPVTGIMNMGPGPEAANVTIPVYGMSFSDCAKLRRNTSSAGFTLDLAQNCETEPDPSVLWGTENGEGDFSNGLGDWYVISEGDTSWYWTDDPVIPGAFRAPRAWEGTACNGYMLFPSDYYDNLGDTGNAGAQELCEGSDPDPSGTRFCVGSLYSPIIDLSGQDVEGLFCSFYHDVEYYYGGATSLIASYDGGITWADTVYVTAGERSVMNNEEIYNTESCEVLELNVNSAEEGTYLVPLGKYNGEDEIQLQFKHYGGYFYATVDDVKLIDASYVDINVGRSFVARNGAEQIPLSQAQAIPFHVDINNLGNLTAENITIKAETFAPDGSVEGQVVNDTYVDYPAFCFINENNTFLETFTPTQLGRYESLYTNITDNDGVESNDTISYRYTMSERTWQSCERPGFTREETDTPGDSIDVYNHMWGGLIIDNPIIDYAIGYHFSTPNGAGHYLNTVRFGINFTQQNSGNVKVYVFEFNPTEASRPAGAAETIAAEDLIPVGCMGMNTFGLVENNQLMSSGIGEQSDITVRISKVNADGQPELDGNGNLIPLELKDNQNYVLVFVMDVTGGNTVEDELHFISASSRAGNQYDVRATNFANGQLGLTARYGGTWQEALPNDGNFADLQTVNWVASHRSSNVPWIEMDIHTEPISTEDITPEAEASVRVFPNPVSELINVDVFLEDQASDVSLELLDINGKLVATEKHSNIKRKIITMNVAHLRSGIYTLNVRSEAGFTSRKVVITK